MSIGFCWELLKVARNHPCRRFEVAPDREYLQKLRDYVNANLSRLPIK